MPNLTDITIWCREEDVASFEAITEASTKRSGLWELDFDDMEPSNLVQFDGLTFCGYHVGHLGDYPAQLFYCKGDGEIRTHTCDQSGRISLHAPGLWVDDLDLDNARELQVANASACIFLGNFQGVMESLVDVVAVDV